MTSDLTPRDYLMSLLEDIACAAFDGSSETEKKARADLLALIERKKQEAVAAVAKERDELRAEVEKLLAERVDLKAMQRALENLMSWWRQIGPLHGHVVHCGDHDVMTVRIYPHWAAAFNDCFDTAAKALAKSQEGGAS